jgi:L-lactate dehydrogenase complex protein LldG
MSNHSRDGIFSRLNSARERFPVPSTYEDGPPSLNLDKDGKTARLKILMEAMRTEVHVVRSDNWIGTLTEILKNKGIKDLLYAPGTDIGAALETCWKGDINNLPKLIPYDRNIAQLKSRLFEVEASITSTAGAVADTGAIILWPDEKEPRLMSLVPPVHIAVLAGNKIYNSLSEVIHEEGWSDRMPANVLLISGPSKTADIELTLAFGVHGPKELLLLVLDDNDR